jgi:hypothetical protein
MAAQGHHDGAYWTRRYEAEYGAPERRVPPTVTPKEGDVKGCTSKNRDGNSCQAHVVEGTDRCHYHKRAEVEVRRSTNGGGAALGALLRACQADRKPVRPAFATIGIGPDKGKLKLHPWMYVDAIDPRPAFNDYGVKFSGRRNVVSSSSIFGAVARVY